jgi:hypothetical protein
MLRTQVEFWEKEHCRLNSLHHMDYPVDVMNSWQRGDTYFPVWTDLRDADRNLIVMPDGCRNAVVRNLALRHLIVMADKERVKEEAVLLQVELARVERFHERRASVLERAFKAKDEDLLFFVMSKEETNDHEDQIEVDDETTAHDLFCRLMKKKQMTVLVEALDWKRYNANYVQLVGVNALLSRAKATLRRGGDWGHSLLRKTQSEVFQY